jgi:hypothetical protein
VVFLDWVFRGGLVSGGGSGLPFVVVVCRGVCSCGVRIGSSISVVGGGGGGMARFPVVWCCCVAVV